MPITLKDGTRAEFWTSSLERKDPVGNEHLRIYWSWRGGGEWRAPEWPRLELARYPFVYKLYVVSEASARAEVLEQDPGVQFLKDFLPRLDDVLAADR